MPVIPARPTPDLGCTMYDPVYVIGDPSLVLAHPTARIDCMVKIETGRRRAVQHNVIIGELVHVASLCHLNIGGGHLSLDYGSSCGSGCRIITGSAIYGPGRGCSAAAPDSVAKHWFVILRRNATLYAGVTVLPGVIVGDGATVAAGSLVRENTVIPPGELWGGNPARCLRLADGTKPSVEWWAERVATVSGKPTPTPLDRFVESQDEFYGRGGR